MLITAILFLSAVAAAEKTPFFMPAIGDSVESVKAKIIQAPPAAYADCAESKYHSSTWTGAHGLFACEDLPTVSGTRALGSIKYMSTASSCPFTIYFKDGVVDGFDGFVFVGHGALEQTFSEYTESATKKYGQPAHIFNYTLQNGFGATFSGAAAVWELTSGATLTLRKLPDSDGTGSVGIELKSKERAAAEKYVAADPFAK
jgi:hypothetical protein